jgi:hypothetical protein
MPSGGPTRTPTKTAAPTPTGPLGPVITFMGLLHADNRYVASDIVGTTSSGAPIYQRTLGTGFIIVVEGGPGADHNHSIGTSSFNSSPSDPTVLPDLQIEVNRNLGDGSLAVCDNMAPMLGGVPGINPPSFAQTQMISNAINDLACRFVNGEGNPMGRPSNEACVLGDDGDYNFINAATVEEYCSVVIPAAMKFQTGDTLVSARLRDSSGNVGPVAQIVVRVTN